MLELVHTRDDGSEDQHMLFLRDEGLELLADFQRIKDKTVRDEIRALIKRSLSEQA